MQDLAAKRAQAKAAGYTDAEIDAYLASTKPKSEAPATPRDATASEGLTGFVRQGMNAITFGQYPKMVGAVNRALGTGPDAEQLAKQMAAYKERYPKLSGLGQLIGTVAQYGTLVGPTMQGVGIAASRVPALAKALKGAEARYQMARRVPLGTKLLPGSAATAAQVAGTEGTRAIAEAPEGATAVDIAKQVAASLPGARIGQIGGTYLAGKFGPTAGKLAAAIQDKAAKVGEKISAWKEGAAVPITSAMAKLYDEKKLLKDAVDEQTRNLGLVANSPIVLARAYSKIVRDIRGTSDAADVQKTVLQPFLREIDKATQGPLSPLIRQYSNAMRAQEAGALGQRTMQYIRERAGDAAKVSPEVVTRRLSQSYATAGEREAAAARLAEELARGMPINPVGTISQVAARVARPFQGAGTATDVIEQLGGLPLRRQRLTQAFGTAAGARAGGGVMSPSGRER